MELNGNCRLLSDLERCEVFNINDGEKYNSLGSNDILIDEEGNLQYLIINLSQSRFNLFSSNNEFLEIPWDNVKKIGTKAIVLDIDDTQVKRTKL